MTVITAERTANTDYVWGAAVLREYQSQGRRQKLEHCEGSGTYTIANIKHSLTPTQVTINPHNNWKLIYLSCYYLLQHVQLSIKNFKWCQKMIKKIQSEESKQSLEPDLDMTKMLDLSDRKLA